MCTVTFIPFKNSQFVLTSNRDEAPNRETTSPDFYHINDSQMLFPKDVLAGGTWIGMSDKQRVICILNGGFTGHEKQSVYRMSRGVVVKTLLSCDDVVTAIENYDFHDIEPFTIVVVDWNAELKLYELVWDGLSKHFLELPIAPKLWSSSTLYTEDMKSERQQWFSEYIDTNEMSAESVLEFHETAGKDNINFGVVMDRGFVKTTSRTQIEKSNDTVSMMYHDLKNDKLTEVYFETSEIINE